MRTEADTLFRTTSRYGFLATLVIAPIAIGGSRSDVQLLCAALAALSLGCLAIRRAPRGVGFIWPLWFFFGVSMFTVFQAIPLPIDWVAFLSPRAAALYREANPDIVWAALSVDPVATMSTALHQMTFAAVVVLAAIHGRKHTHTVGWAIIGIATLCALIGAAHILLGFDRIYGVYDALHRDTMTGFFGPFVNENTMAGLLILGGLTAAGVAVVAETSVEKCWALVAGLVCIAGVFATGSRGGQVALVLGWILFGMLSFATKWRETDAHVDQARHLFGYGLVIVVGAFVASVALLDDWCGSDMLRLLEDDKFQALNSISYFVQDYPWFGSGRGTFSVVYPHYQLFDVQGTVTHPENVVVQFVSEWGLVAGAGALIGAVVAFACGVWHATTRGHALLWGTLAGVGAAALQQGVDFGFESMGLSLPVGAGLGIAFASRHKRVGAVPQVLLISMPLIMVALLVLGGRAIVDVRKDGHLDALAQGALTAEALDRSATRIAREHPADYLIPLLTSAALAKQKPVDMPRFMKWMNRSQRLFPAGGRAHHIAARVLVATGRPQQAAGEFRRAIEKQPWAELAIIGELARALKTPRVLLRAIPPTRSARQRLVDSLFQDGHNQTALDIANELILWAPDDFAAHVFRSRALLSLGQLDAVDADVAWFMRRGYASRGFGFAARAAVARGQGATGKALLERGMKSGGKRDPDFLRQAARCYVRLGDTNGAREALDMLWHLHRADPPKAVQVLLLRARVESSIGDASAAIEAYDRAFLLAPSPDCAGRAAELELKTGRVQDARRRIIGALRRWPNSSLLTGLARRIKKRSKKAKRDGRRPDH